MAQKITATESPTPTLPTIGMSRFNQIKPFINISREKYRQLVRAGKAPQPVTMSLTCVMYRNEELHQFLKDPMNYSVEPVSIPTRPRKAAATSEVQS